MGERLALAALAGSSNLPVGIDTTAPRGDSDARSIAGQSIAARAMSGKRGRSKRVGPRPCGICEESSHSEDPNAVCESEMVITDMSIEQLESLGLLLRWAYPPVGGQPQGAFCWYCSQAVVMHPEFSGKSCSEVRTDCEKNPLVRQRAKQIKQIVVQVARENNGIVRKALLTQKDVTHFKTHGRHKYFDVWFARLCPPLVSGWPLFRLCWGGISCLVIGES